MTSKEEFLFSILIVKCLEGSISDPELAGLNEILRTDPDAAKIYAEQMFINSHIKLPGNLASFKVTEPDFDTGEFEAVIPVTVPRGGDHSNVSLRGVDLQEFMADVDADDSDDREMDLDYLEILELVRTSPAVEIEKPKPVKEKPELIQKVVYQPREKRKLSKFQKFFFTATAAAVIFFVLLVKFTPEPVPSVAVATVSDQMNVKWAQSSFSLETGSRLWTKDFPLHIIEGIVSIEFDEGVEVVIEGPALFEIERKGIYLEYGRLYGKVSETGHGFTVNTPNSQFVDLGTEFGVLSDINGSSELHVTKGKVQMIAGLKGKSMVSQMITENEAARFDAIKGSVKLIKIRKKAFVRNIDSKSGFIWKGQTKIDLSDIFGGGDGFGSGKIGTYLDVRTGKFTSLQGGSEKGRGLQKPDETFITVDQSPFIDSVFTPDGGDGSVQVSSVGHVFDNCPDTSGWINDSNIFNGDTIKLGKQKRPVQLGNVRYGTKENPAITIRANRGITFDLEAIRRSMGVAGFERFTAKCGINWRGEASEDKTDFYVLVDGQVRFNATEKREISEPSNVDVPLGRDDRFLTLVVTKGDISENGKWMVIAEPVLHIGD